MSYLLDTSTCVWLLRGKPISVRSRADRAIVGGDRLFLSSIVLHELWYGAYESQRAEDNAGRLEAFLEGWLEICAFDEEDARTAGRIRAELEQAGKTIGAYDTLIAGQCLRNDLTLVTCNTAEFRRVKGLRLEDWAE